MPLELVITILIIALIVLLSFVYFITMENIKLNKSNENLRDEISVLRNIKTINKNKLC